MAQFEGLIRRLAKHEVEFVVVGGYAAMIHGSSLLTQDIDICCRMSSENIFKIRDAVQDLHPMHGKLIQKQQTLNLEENFVRNLKNLYIKTDWGELDCLGEIKGVGNYDQVLSKSEEMDLDGVQCRILSLEFLIQAKKAMGRPKDEHVVLELESIREKLREGEK